MGVAAAMTIVNGVSNGAAAAAAANGSRTVEAHDGYFTSAVSVQHKVRSTKFGMSCTQS